MDRYIDRALSRNFRKIKIRKKKFGKNNVSGSLLRKHPMRVLNVAEVHGVLHGAWWCDPPGGVQG